jgi:L-gulonate 3-dehydrogenase
MGSHSAQGGVKVRIAVVGAGSIGIGWALHFASYGHEVRLFDVDAAQLASVDTRVKERLQLLSEHSLITDSIDAIANRISTHDTLAEAVTGASYIQECGPENLEFKRNLFLEIENSASDSAVIASSSSAIPSSKFTGSMQHPERALVVHPGNPPYLLLIAELVPHANTSAEVLGFVRDLLESTGMSAVIVRGEPEGFVFNRLQGAVLREAYCLVRDGVISPRELDEIMIRGLGKRWSLIGAFGTSALNVRGGITAHAARMGDSYHRMGIERGQDDPWTDELVAQVAEDIAKKFLPDHWEADVVKRDLALMKLTAVMKELGL